MSRGLTSLLDSHKNKASLAAGPAAAICCCCCRYRCCCCCCRLPQRTPRHTETPCYWRTEQPPKTCCPEAWRPFWILLDSAIAAAGPAAAPAAAAAKNKASSAAGPAAAAGAAGAGAASLQNAPFATPKHHATEGRNHLQGTEGRKRRLASRLHCLTLPSEPARNQLQTAAPMPSKQLHSEVLAGEGLVGDSETAKHHGTKGRKRRLESRLCCLTLPSEPTRN